MNKYTHIMITFTFRCYLITSGNYIMNTIPFLATTIIPDTVLPQGFLKRGGKTRKDSGITIILSNICLVFIEQLPNQVLRALILIEPSQHAYEVIITNIPIWQMSREVSELPRPTAQALGRAGVHTQSACRARILTDGTVCATAPMVGHQQAWGHSVPMANPQTSNPWRRGIYWTEQHQTPSRVSRAAEKQRNWTCQLAPPSPRCPWKKAAERRPRGGHPCHLTNATPVCSSLGRRAIRAASCTHALEKSD